MYAETIDMWAALLIQDLVVMRPMLELVMGEDAQSIIATLIDGAPDITVETTVMLQAGRAQAMRLWSAFFAEHPELEGRPLVLFLGRLHPKKRPEALIAAHPTLMKRPVIRAGDALHLGWAKAVQAELL